MCAEKTKEDGNERERKDFCCKPEDCEGMFEKMSEMCGCGERPDECFTMMKGMMNRKR